MFGRKRIGKIRTPIYSLNVAGCGGLNVGTITEAWGSPKGGKTTFCWQTGEYFLEDYGDDAVFIILTAENSIDLRRMKTVFGIMPGIKVSSTGEYTDIPGGDPRVLIAPAMTVEMGTANYTTAVNFYKDKYVLGVWDSISASIPKSEWDALLEALEKDKPEEQFTGGMMAKPRSLAAGFAKIMGIMWDNPKSSLIFINQERVKVGRYVSGVYATGGKAKEHAMHNSIHFAYQGKEEINDFLKKGTKSIVTIEKSKFMPSFANIPIFIDDTKGGKFVGAYELLNVGKEMGLVTYNKQGGRYEVPGVEKKLHAKDAIKNKDFLRSIYKSLIGVFRDNYMMVNTEYEEYEEADATPVKKKKKLKKRRTRE